MKPWPFIEEWILKCIIAIGSARGDTGRRSFFFYSTIVTQSTVFLNESFQGYLLSQYHPLDESQN
jgi:hypothetical protein